MLVDDDHDLRTMIRLMLEYKGFEVISPEKIGRIKDIPGAGIVDLIIMDMLLSGLNGLDICADLKNDNETKHIPVIMISAHPNAREACLNAGADDFISKPFDMQDMVKKINHHVIKIRGS